MLKIRSLKPSFETLLGQGVVEVVELNHLRQKLGFGRSLRVKFGVDPTSSDLHLGHAAVLDKARQFQDLGHQVYLVIGDFTALIGDPSGINTTRPVLTKKQIADNMANYTKQAGQILNLKQTKIVYNSEWLGKLSLTDFIGYAMRLSVNNLIERQDFQVRLSKGDAVALHELIYPVAQAIDSVELKADVELGGYDQRLNLLLGRELQRKMGQEPQDAIMMKLLVGTDGHRKMSSSYGNYIGITENPDEMFGKLMSIPDAGIPLFAELLVPELARLRIESIKHPRDRKFQLAQSIVARFHTPNDAKQAGERFEQTFRHHMPSDELHEVVLSQEMTLSLTRLVSQVAKLSASEAKRLINQKAIKVEGQTVTDARRVLDLTKNDLRLQIGQHRFYFIKRSNE